MAVVDKNKLLGKVEKGGDLMVRPTTSLVESPGGKITETSDEKDVVYTISTKLVKVDKFLKGTLAADKVAQKKEQKQKEDELRAEQEKDTEKPDKKDEKETPKSLIPKLSFLDGIKKFLGDVLMGWLVFRLIKFLPKIVSFLKPAAAFVDWILKWGGRILDGLITLVDWGYKAVEGTRSLIGNLFGEKGVEAFDSITGTLNTVFNLIAAIGLAAVAFTNEWGNQEDPEVNRRNRLKNKKRQERLKDPEYKRKFDERVKSRRQYKRQQTLNKWKKRLGIDQPKVQGAKQPNLFDKMKKRFTPDPTAVKKPSIGQRLGNWWESGAAGRKKLGTQITEGAANLQKRGTQLVTDVGDSFNKHVSGPITKQLDKVNPKQWLKTLANNDDLVGSAGAKRLIALIESPVLKKWLGRAPLIGDALIFISDILRGVHWTRALMRTATAFGIDYGFGALISASVLAAPVSGGASLALTAALTAAYMAADQLGGWALKGEDYHQGDGIGQVLGDKLANALGLPKKAGMPGEEGKAWESMFGGSGTPKVDPDKIMKGLSDKEKEAIARVDGKNGKDGKNDEKDKELLKLEQRKMDIIGGTNWSSTKEMQNDPEYIAIEKEIKDFHARKYNVKGNSNNIVSTNGVSNRVNGVSSSASYEEGAGETVIIKSGSEEDTTGDEESTESLTVVAVNGGEGGDEVGDLLYKGG